MSTPGQPDNQPALPEADGALPPLEAGGEPAPPEAGTVTEPAPPVADTAPEEARHLPASLWERLREDPVRAPEHLALAAAERHGPAAAEWLAERRAFYGADPQKLAQMAVKRHVSLARVGGAATGVGGIVTVLPDMAALAWIQSRMVFFVAAAFGHDPRDPMRPAELLVLQEIYPDTGASRRALDGTGDSIAETWVGNRMSRDEELYRRLVRMGGKAAGKRLLGRAIPGFAIAFNAVSNGRDTKALGNRTVAFYGGHR